MLLSGAAEKVKEEGKMIRRLLNDAK